MELPVELWLAVLGAAGQAVFLLAFLAGRFGEGRTPPVWLRLLAGAGGVAVMAYGVIRSDYVLCVGQAAALFIFLRRSSATAGQGSRP